eukprot:Sspe_Gene.108019::Locus_87176_Transcript_1_1_Confidence_1.000_Length_397::g.108019::m.108019
MAYGSRLNIEVRYITSGCNSANRSALHFFQITGEGPKPLKRIVVLQDKNTYEFDLGTAMNRCVMISKIKVMGVFPEHARSLTAPLTQYDLLLQHTNIGDVIRMLPCVFKPHDPADPVT